MPNLAFPQDTSLGPGQGRMGPVWVKFHGQTARKFNAASAVATVTTPDATDLASVITLVNALKVTVNALISAMNA